MESFCEFGCAEHVCHALDVVGHGGKADFNTGRDNAKTIDAEDRLRVDHTTHMIARDKIIEQHWK